MQLVHRNFLTFKGKYRTQRKSGILQLKKLFWPNGEQNPPVLDKNQT
jgi:hypothetical protein